jgi:hypothetical protein
MIILIVPYLFTLPIFNVYKSETGSTGEIGDTIGGLTAPFINGIGAILVYLAFKEQVKATHQTTNLENYKIINDRLNWLKGDPYDIVLEENRIRGLLNARRVVPQHPFNKMTFLLLEFEELHDLAIKNSEDSQNLVRQIGYLYRILYRDRMETIQLEAITFLQFNASHQHVVIVIDFMTAYRNTEEKLGL